MARCVIDHDDPITAWFEAVERDDIQALKDLLGRGVDVDSQGDSTGTTALMLAARDRRIAMMEVLLAHGASPNIENSLGLSAMTYALINSRPREGRWVVEWPDPRPLELLLAAGGRFGLRDAVILDDIELVRARLDEGADPNSGDFTYDGPMLMVAAGLGHHEVVSLLLDRGAGTEVTDDLNRTALIDAAQYGHIRVVALLLDRGAEIDAIDWCGDSPLASAAIAQCHDVVALLLSRGARRGLIDAVVLDDEEFVAAFLREEAGQDPSESGRDLPFSCYQRALEIAVGRGQTGIVRRLLECGFTHRYEPYNERTLLAEAARGGHVEVVRTLIELGADLHAVGRDGLTPLAWAIRAGRDEVAACLRGAGAIR